MLHELNNLEVKRRTAILLEESVGENVCPWVRQKFLGYSTESMISKRKEIDKLYFMKI